MNNSSGYTLFKDQLPTETGFYFVVFEEGNEPEKLLLILCKKEDYDDSEDVTEDFWVWGWDESDDREGVDFKDGTWYAWKKEHKNG